MSYSYHYWQHAYNLNILAFIAATQLTFKGPIHGGGAQGTISHFMWGLASRLGFLTLPDKPGYRDSFGAVHHDRVGTEKGGGTLWGKRGGKAFFGVVVLFLNPFFSFFLRRSYQPLFPGRMKYPWRLVRLGILFWVSSFCGGSKAKERNPGWGGFKLRWEKKKNSSQGFLLLSPSE